MRKDSQADLGFYHAESRGPEAENVRHSVFRGEAELPLRVYVTDIFGYDVPMRNSIRFMWNANKGHRLTPWRSPYLLWRIETYTGVKMKQIGFLEFWEFMWRERSNLWRFLRWTGEIQRYVHPKPKSS